MSKVHELMLKINSSLDGQFGANIQKIVGGVDKTSQKFKELSAEQAKIKDLELKIKGFEKTQGQIEAIKSKKEMLIKKEEEHLKAMESLEKGSDAYKEMAEKVKFLEKEKNKAIETEKKLKIQSELQNEQLKKEGISTGNLAKEKHNLSDKSKKLKKDVEKLTEAQKKNSEETKKMATFFKNAPLAISGAVIASSIAFGKMGMDFSSSVAQVATVADSSQVSMQKMGVDILKLSKETGIAAGLLSKDVYDAISSGVQTSDSVKTVATNSKLAKAGFAESSQSLDLLTTIVNGYGKSMKEADKISDILINTQNKGKVTVAQLASSMGKIIPTANASNVSLEQIASGYAIMTSKGIASAESTTYMNSMLNELSKSGTGASNVLKKATGKSFQDLMKDGKSLSDVLGILENSAKKDKESLADMFGSAEAGKAALVLATNSGKDFNEMVKSMENSSGATQEAFDKLNAEPLEKFKKSVNNLKVKGIELGMAMLPLVTKIMDGFLKFTQLPLVEWLTGSSNSAKVFIGVITGLTVAIGGYYLGLKAVQGWTKLVAVAQFLWNAALTANPIGIIIAAFAGFIAGLIYAYKNFETFRNLVNNSWASIQELWFVINQNPFAKFAIDILALANPITAIMRHFDKLKGAWDWVKDKVGLGGDDKPTPGGKPKPTGGNPYSGGYPPNVPKFAIGGVVNKPTYALVGEAGSETIIPHNRDPRSLALLQLTAQKMGVPLGGEKKTIFSSGGTSNKVQNTSNTKQIIVNEVKIIIDGALENPLQKGKELAQSFKRELEKLGNKEENERRLSLE